MKRLKCLIELVGNNPDSGTSKSPWRIYNIGSHVPVKLMAYIELLEQALGREIEKVLMPLQPGDVIGTFAEIDDLIKDFDYKPQISINHGIRILQNGLNTSINSKQLLFL